MSARVILGAIFIIVVLILFGVYYFMPFSELEFTAIPLNHNFTINGSLDSIQFYPNMRFENKNLSYQMFECNIKKKEDMRYAFDIMENITILSFYPVIDNEDITITCDEKVKFKEGMFIAGEGGPTQIVRAGNNNVILHGSILLMKSSNCPNPNVALHELLHVLGFIHSNNPNNLMYNYTKCIQTIGDEIPSILNEVYSTPSFPDLVFENASASMKGRYLNLEFSVRNIGLKNAGSSMVDVKMNNKTIKEIELNELDIGSGTVISIENLFVKNLGLGDLKLIIDYSGEEIDKENNYIVLQLE